MKETGTTHWLTPNTGATNTSGFTAVPGGYRYSYDGTFSYVGYRAYFWSSIENSSYHAWYRDLFYNDSIVNRGTNPKPNGQSVRCIRD